MRERIEALRAEVDKIISTYRQADLNTALNLSAAALADLEGSLVQLHWFFAELTKVLSVEEVPTPDCYDPKVVLIQAKSQAISDYFSCYVKINGLLNLEKLLAILKALETEVIA